MGLFKKQPLDEHTQLLDKYAKAKWGVYASPVLLAIVVFAVRSIVKVSTLFFIVAIVLAVVNCLYYLVQSKKLRKQLEAEAPLSENDKLYVKKYIKKTLITLVAVLALVGIMYTIADSPSSKHDSRYKEVFGKDPNDWNEADKEYVNDLFAWIDKQNGK